MSKGPGLFSDIGKKAKDLLTKDYISDQKFSVSTYSDTGVGQMLALKLNPIQEGQQPPCSAKIVEEVLGKRSTYTLSLGCRTNDSSSISRNAALEDELEQYKSQMADMMEQMRDMAARQKVYEQFISRMVPPQTQPPSAGNTTIDL